MMLEKCNTKHGTMKKGHCKLSVPKIGLPTLDQVHLLMIENDQQLKRKQLHQVNVKLEHWGTPYHPPKTFA